jgi:cytoskeletal protein CcmA (bactofilin family)/uncharacterized membrane protein HdeD (DUF308 family)
MIRGSTILLSTTLWLCAFAARADVTHKGSWPEPGGERVTLSVSGTRSEAIARLAEAAGWSVVMRDLPPSKLEVEVKEQPAAEVLGLLLADGNYVATRTGSMVAIAIDTAAASGSPLGPTRPPAPPSAIKAKAAKHARDLTLAGQSVTVARDEVVRDLTVFGGSVEVLGTVTGDVSVFGGSVKIADEAHVQGDVSAVGGSVNIATGAQVDGDVTSTGGDVDRSVRDSADDKPDEPARRKHASSANHERGWFADEWESFLGTLARAALLFAFGTVLITLLGPRMQRLQSAFVERPTRAAALGIVGLGGALLTIAALCITIVGIPVAILVVLSGALCIYAGICAVFTSLGAALLGHRNDNPYVHLAVGCALYCVLSSLPIIGTLVTVLAVLVATGVLISTRAAGFFSDRDDDDSSASGWQP